MAESPSDREKSRPDLNPKAGTPEVEGDESVEILEVVGMDEAEPQIEEKAAPEKPPEGVSEAGAQAEEDGEDSIPYSRRELYDMLLRKQADFENARKRMAREREDLSRRTWIELLESILPVLDNFDRALSEPVSSPQEGFHQGVAMTYQQLHEILNREGLEAIRAVGEAFDPNLHEAVELVHSDVSEEGTVLEEMRKGYKFREHLLRPSLVKVSTRGGQNKPEPTE